MFRLCTLAPGLLVLASLVILLSVKSSGSIFDNDLEAVSSTKLTRATEKGLIRTISYGHSGTRMSVAVQLCWPAFRHPDRHWAHGMPGDHDPMNETTGKLVTRGPRKPLLFNWGQRTYGLPGPLLDCVLTNKEAGNVRFNYSLCWPMNDTMPIVDGLFYIALRNPVDCYISMFGRANYTNLAELQVTPSTIYHFLYLTATNRSLITSTQHHAKFHVNPCPGSSPDVPFLLLTKTGTS